MTFSAMLRRCWPTEGVHVFRQVPSRVGANRRSDLSRPSFGQYREFRSDCRLLVSYIEVNTFWSGTGKRRRVHDSRTWTASRYHRSVRHFLLRDLRFRAELGWCESLFAEVVLHIITAAIRRGRQEADLRYDDLRAIPALAGLPVVPGARPQRALDIQPRALTDIIAQDLGRPLETDQVVPLGVFLPIAVDVPIAFAGGERKVTFQKRVDGSSATRENAR